MKEFLEEIFNKAEKESGIESLRGKCEYISETLLEDFKYQLSYKSLERYAPSSRLRLSIATIIRM